MMVDGLNGALLEIVPPRKEAAREHVRETVIHPNRLSEDYNVMDTTQRQEIVKRINVLVSIFRRVKNY